MSIVGFFEEDITIDDITFQYKGEIHRENDIYGTGDELNSEITIENFEFTNIEEVKKTLIQRLENYAVSHFLKDFFHFVLNYFDSDLKGKYIEKYRRITEPVGFLDFVNTIVTLKLSGFLINNEYYLDGNYTLRYRANIFIQDNMIYVDNIQLLNLVDLLGNIQEVIERSIEDSLSDYLN